MERNLAAYIKVLSDDDYDIFEDIFLERYRKFIYMYNIISCYSDIITKLKYEESDKGNLKIEFSVSKKKVNDVLSEIEDYTDNKSVMDCKYWNKGKSIFIELTKDESELP
jgi:hypothetical protein